jgi:hypothetical protein
MYHVSGRQHAAEAGGRRRAGTGGQPACPGRCAYVQLYALPCMANYMQAPYSRLNFVLSCRSSRHAVHLCVAAQQQHASAAARGERALPAP